VLDGKMHFQIFDFEQRHAARLNGLGKFFQS